VASEVTEASDSNTVDMEPSSDEEDTIQQLQDQHQEAEEDSNNGSVSMSGGINAPFESVSRKRKGRRHGSASSQVSESRHTTANTSNMSLKQTR